MTKSDSRRGLQLHLLIRIKLSLPGPSSASQQRSIFVYIAITMDSLSLPPDFLSGPALNLQKTNIDWKKTDLPEYDGLYAAVLDGVFTKEECDLLVHAAEATADGKWEQAMVNIGNGQQTLATETRDCGRIIWDDGEIAARLWARCKDHMKEIESLYAMPQVTGKGPFKRQETWRMTRPNERMRFLKYGKDQYFRRKSMTLIIERPQNCRR